MNIKASWEEIDELVNSLAEKIRQSGVKPRFIYGIPRGGWIVAVMLSHKLGGVPVTQNPRERFVLFVDDICDEGKSLLYHSNKSEEYTTAVLYARTDIFSPDFVGEYIDNHIYVDFPWETKRADRYAGKLIKEEERNGEQNDLF